MKASILGNNYIFESERFLKPYIQIIGLGEKEILGQIDFHFFRPRAELNLSGVHFEWKFENMVGTKWSLKDGNGNILIHADSRKEGNFSMAKNTNPLLLISALVIRNHFTKNGY